MMGQPMSRPLYESSNGDTWHLVAVGGEPMVRHVPNAPSGSHASEVPVGTFLSAVHHGPEHAELLRLIATLAMGEGRS